MDRALDLAQQGGEAGEIPVGALVVSMDGTIFGESANYVERKHDPTAHAEIVALREACRMLKNHRLKGCALVSTLEPCAMCAAAIINARLCGIVFGATDPARGAVVSRAEYLSGPASASAWHIGGIRAMRCAEILENFFQKLRKQDCG